MQRRVIAGLVVVGLAIGIWLVWPRGDTPESTTTTVLAADSTTTSETDPTAPPTIAPDPTTSTTEADGVVDTVEEAEAILRELWFGWFEGIYNQDEDRIREVVATEEYLDAGKEAMETVEFDGIPSKEGITFQELEILRSDEDCLSAWSISDASFVAGGQGRAGVDVLRRLNDSWLLTSSWANRNDLWDADCEALLQPLP